MKNNDSNCFCLDLERYKLEIDLVNPCKFCKSFSLDKRCPNYKKMFDKKEAGNDKEKD